MANKKSDAYTSKLEWQIYIILFPPNKEYYVGMSSQKNLYTTFKDHCTCRYMLTKPYVEEVKAKKLIPENESCICTR